MLRMRLAGIAFPGNRDTFDESLSSLERSKLLTAILIAGNAWGAQGGVVVPMVVFAKQTTDGPVKSSRSKIPGFKLHPRNPTSRSVLILAGEAFRATHPHGSRPAKCISRGTTALSSSGLHSPSHGPRVQPSPTQCCCVQCKLQQQPPADRSRQNQTQTATMT